MGKVVIAAFMQFFKKLFLASVTQTFIEWVFFKCADVLVKSTENTMDNEAVEKLKALYFKESS